MVCDAPGFPMVRVESPQRDDEDRQPDRDDDDSPETPLDEPKPTPVQDPPPQPDQQGPYVVSD
jgi:hypothetical protein